LDHPGKAGKMKINEVKETQNSGIMACMGELRKKS
jgi:hypothetical protein